MYAKEEKQDQSPMFMFACSLGKDFNSGLQKDKG